MSVLVAPRVGPAVGRRVGTAAGGALALALLACGCVFAALAGPALSLHTRTQALHQVLAGLPNTTRTVQVTAAWSDFVGSLPGARQLNQDQLTQVNDQIGAGLAAQPLPLGAGQWTSLTTKGLVVGAGAGPKAQAAAPPSWRSPTAPRWPATRRWWPARWPAAALRPARWR